MCIALIAHRVHPAYALVIAANRDELHARPTAPATWWPEGILAGRDLSAGGTWFGVRRSGRLALVTNYRDGRARDASPAPPGQRSRGQLVVDALLDSRPPQRAVADLLADGDQYQGFNLIAGNPGELFCASNRSWTVKRLGEGVFGLSNHLLDSPWPKVERAKEALRDALREPVIATETLFALLNDRTQAADHELPDTGVGLERERFLSPPFIVGETYGTRSSTVLLVDRLDGALFIERTFDPAGNAAGDARFEFALARG
jgi:uncharacterized protein with NRDE domain